MVQTRQIHAVDARENRSSTGDNNSYGGRGRGNGTSASATVFDENYTGTRDPAFGEAGSASENDRTRASGDRAGTGGASEQSSAGSAACTDM